VPPSTSPAVLRTMPIRRHSSGSLCIVSRTASIPIFRRPGGVPRRTGSGFVWQDRPCFVVAVVGHQRRRNKAAEFKSGRLLCRATRARPISVGPSSVVYDCRVIRKRAPVTRRGRTLGAQVAGRTSITAFAILASGGRAEPAGTSVGVRLAPPTARTRPIAAFRSSCARESEREPSTSIVFERIGAGEGRPASADGRPGPLMAQFNLAGHASPIGRPHPQAGPQPARAEANRHTIARARERPLGIRSTHHACRRRRRRPSASLTRPQPTAVDQARRRGGRSDLLLPIRPARQLAARPSTQARPPTRPTTRSMTP
jgi:hypothetical protein